MPRPTMTDPCAYLCGSGLGFLFSSKPCFLKSWMSDKYYVKIHDQIMKIILKCRKIEKAASKQRNNKTCRKQGPLPLGTLSAIFPQFACLHDYDEKQMWVKPEFFRSLGKIAKIAVVFRCSGTILPTIARALACNDDGTSNFKINGWLWWELLFWPVTPKPEPPPSSQSKSQR